MYYWISISFQNVSNTASDAVEAVTIQFIGKWKVYINIHVSSLKRVEPSGCGRRYGIGGMKSFEVEDHRSKRKFADLVLYTIFGYIKKELDSKKCMTFLVIICQCLALPFTYDASPRVGARWRLRSQVRCQPPEPNGLMCSPRHSALYCTIPAATSDCTVNPNSNSVLFYPIRTLESDPSPALNFHRNSKATSDVAVATTLMFSFHGSGSTGTSCMSRALQKASDERRKTKIVQNGQAYTLDNMVEVAHRRSNGQKMNVGDARAHGIRP
ncbi:hypothetical protein EVAR_7745_1 [Eumeta japonica]|uniref:Uncharacterized protein n=1 Tax=Eumeta variegata TaxID=151549 RepID=A0A4C1TIZ7_EUMVA|nr:hypothetical protein EVAR_7745_1 [Eumeta japonica]